MWGGGGVESGGGVNRLESEYGRAIHCDAPKSENIHGVRSEDRFTGIKMVVGTGRDKLQGERDVVVDNMEERWKADD